MGHLGIHSHSLYQPCSSFYGALSYVYMDSPYEELSYVYMDVFLRALIFHREMMTSSQ